MSRPNIGRDTQVGTYVEQQVLDALTELTRHYYPRLRSNGDAIRFAAVLAKAVVIDGCDAKTAQTQAEAFIAK